MNKKLKDTMLGGITQNPVFILVLGMCSVLAVSSDLKSAMGMSAAVIVVLILSNVLISLIRKIVPDKVRIPCYIVVIATLVTLVKMVMRAYLPDLFESLGGFLDLIVVNCIIFARAEGFAKNNGVGYAALDGVSMGIGYALAMFLMAFVKELLGLGTLFGAPIFKTFSIPFFQTSAGSLMTLALLIAAYTTVVAAIKNRKTKAAKEPAAQETAEVTK